MALEHGKAFVHEQIVFGVGNTAFITIKNLTYSENKDKDFNYGTGSEPHSYGTAHEGPVEISFQINFTEHLQLKDGQLDRKVTNILPFDIPITYANSQSPRLETLKNVLIKKATPQSESGNKDIMVTYEAIASHVTSKPL